MKAFNFIKFIIVLTLLANTAFAKRVYYKTLDELIAANVDQTGFVQKLGYLEYHPDDIYEGMYYIENPYPFPALGLMGKMECFLGDQKKLKALKNSSLLVGDQVQEIVTFVNIELLSDDSIELKNVIQRGTYGTSLGPAQDSSYPKITILNRCK